ncbi:MAG: hypothetical protein Q4A70_01200 [Candidatus Saccharibacteria bacterium]|nr:hypothetical protein [Candidatus Saccharibacteria bacterium]
MMGDFVNLIKYSSKTFKVVAGAVLSLFIVIVVVTIIVLNRPILKDDVMVDIGNFEDMTPTPKGYMHLVEKGIGEIINGASNDDELVFADAAIREGSYKESENENEKKAEFIVDIDSLHYSFDVTLSWRKDSGDSEPEDPDILIECPHYLDVIYKDKKCIAQSPQAQLARYLPYYDYVGDKKYAVDFRIFDGEKYLRVEVSTCGDESLRESVIDSIKKWLKTIYLDPNDYKMELIDICRR